MNKEKAAKNFVKLLEIVETLRGPDGCPWDKEQTHESLLPYFLEEAYEVIESVDDKDWKTFREELGDVMLHIVLQAQIAREDKKFTIIDSLDKKVVSSYPSFALSIINSLPSAFKQWLKLYLGKYVTSEQAVDEYDDDKRQAIFTKFYHPF